VSKVYPVLGSSHYCDMSEEKGEGVAWTLLMTTAADATLEYNSAYWTNSATYNANSPAAKAGVSAKYDAFNKMPVSALKLDNLDSGAYTILTLPKANKGSTMQSLFANGASIPLTVYDGITTPLELASGEDGNSGKNKYCGTYAWLINQKDGCCPFYMRIGGTFAGSWDCSYGNDKNGHQTGAASAGFGLRDDTWSPFSYATKGFGIRQAHDNAGYPNGKGQIYRSGAIWGADQLPVKPYCSILYDAGDRVSGIKTIAGTSVYCDLSGKVGGKAWTLLMNIKSDSFFHYSSSYWTSSETYNSATPTKSAGTNAKYDTFNKMKVSKLRLDNPDLGTNTIVTPAASGKTLLDMMKTGNSLVLNVDSGASSPVELATGKQGTSGSHAYCGKYAWLINGNKANRGAAFGQRIGGTFHGTWGCGYGSDANNQPTSASMAGFGLRDRTWSPYNYADKGFGIREAHDYTSQPSGDGQKYSNGLIWAY
jgi:hypothetical protein